MFLFFLSEIPRSKKFSQVLSDFSFSILLDAPVLFSGLLFSLRPEGSE